MGATSPGLDQGTTVYFELPLFSCVSAGIQPLASLPSSHIRSAEAAASTSSTVSVSDPLIIDDREYRSPVSLIPTRIKPRPPSFPLNGSVVVVRDSDLDASFSCQIQSNPQLG